MQIAPTWDLRFYCIKLMKIPFRKYTFLRLSMLSLRKSGWSIPLPYFHGWLPDSARLSPSVTAMQGLMRIASPRIMP